MKFDELMSQLNTQQKEAVVNDSCACLVNANVGSGKTTVLISKIFYLNKVKDIDFNKMIVLTFTNKAANEIKERLLAIDPNIKEEDMLYFGTFHSVAMKLLQVNLDVISIGYNNKFSIIDPDEEMDLATSLIVEYSLNIKYMNKLSRRLELAKQGKYTYSAMKYDDDIKKLMVLIKEEKCKQNKMSFDDLINHATELVKKEKDFVNWIIVDEFQDCDGKQLEFIDNLMGLKTKIFAVGDPNQVIYTWRGSSLNIFEKFKKEYKAEEISLPLNYRSCSTILEVAKCFLGTKTDLCGMRESGHKIIVKEHYDAFNEAQYLKDQIKKLVSMGVAYNEIAIFYRLQKQSKVLENVLSKDEIPYEVSMRKTLKDIPVLGWIIKVLKFSLNHKDLSNGILAISHQQFGEHISELEAKKMIMQHQTGQSKLLDKMLEFETRCGEQEDIIVLYEYFELDDYLIPTSAQYQENKVMVQQLLTNISEYIVLKKVSFYEGMKEFINSSALYGVDILRRDVHIESHSVKLMTLHASKGLEFKYVFIIGVNYGYIPMQKIDLEELEEEKRLFFVGITRAKDYLELSYYKKSDDWSVIGGASNYLSMIPKELIADENTVIIETQDKLSVQEIRKKAMESKQKKDKAISTQLKEKTLAHTETILTDVTKKVAHPKYGIGNVIKEDEQIITVIFEDFGEKEFVKAFCELEEITAEEKLEQIVEIDVNQITYEVHETKNTVLERKVSHPKYGIGTVLSEDEMMIGVSFDGYGKKEFIKAFSELEEVNIANLKTENIINITIETQKEITCCDEHQNKLDVELKHEILIVDVADPVVVSSKNQINKAQEESGEYQYKEDCKIKPINEMQIDDHIDCVTLLEQDDTNELKEGENFFETRNNGEIEEIINEKIEKDDNMELVDTAQMNGYTQNIAFVSEDEIVEVIEVINHRGDAETKVQEEASNNVYRVNNTTGLLNMDIIQTVDITNNVLSSTPSNMYEAKAREKGLNEKKGNEQKELSNYVYKDGRKIEWVEEERINDVLSVVENNMDKLKESEQVVEIKMHEQIEESSKCGQEEYGKVKGIDETEKREDMLATKIYDEKEENNHTKTEKTRSIQVVEDMTVNILLDVQTKKVAEPTKKQGVAKIKSKLFSMLKQWFS